MISSLLAGFATAIALICAIGAQNAFVLRQGLRGQHVLPVVVICFTSDALLITLGIAGLGAVVTSHQDLVAATRWGGAAFLLCYAVFAARRALRPGTLTPADRPAAALGATILACLAFTYLNPHVYIDTVLLLGSVANHDPHRWVFAVGASLASVTWFTALGFGAQRIAPHLAKPVVWRVLDGLIAVTMIVIAASLAFSG